VKKPDGKPAAAERAELVQLLIARGISPSVAATLVSTDRTRKENSANILAHITNIKRV
jgi:hypothetical protein